MKLFCEFVHFPWDQKWQDYKVEEDFFFAREQYTRVPLLYLEVEELYEKGGRYRFDMCICLHCSIQKEWWNKMSFVSEEPIKRFKKSCVSNMSWKEIILFHSVQGKTFYSSIRLTFWRSKDKFYVTWFLTSCMSLLSLFEWLSRFICLEINIWFQNYQASTLNILVFDTWSSFDLSSYKKYF